MRNIGNWYDSFGWYRSLLGNIPLMLTIDRLDCNYRNIGSTIAIKELSRKEKYPFAHFISQHIKQAKKVRIYLKRVLIISEIELI